MVYWSTVILTVDSDGYCNRHHRTFLGYTGLPKYLTVDITNFIELMYGILVYGNTHS